MSLRVSGETFPFIPTPIHSELLQKWLSLGYPEEIYNRYPDFVEFIIHNHLHNMLAYYGDELVVEAHSSEPSLLFRGRMEPWSYIAQQLTFEDDGKTLKGWFYTFDRGLDEYDSLEWQGRLRPIRQENASQSPTFTICSSKKNYAQPMLKDVHCSIEIKDKDGFVYNFGLWAPEDFGTPTTAFATHEGKLYSPDGYEFMGARVSTIKTSFTISEEQCSELLQHIQALKDQGVPFSWSENNCAEFALSLARVAGIDIDISCNIFFNALPQCVQDTLMSIWNALPCFIQTFLWIILKIITLVPNILFNSVRLILGAADGFTPRVSTCSTALPQEKIAVINSVADFFFKGIDQRNTLPRVLYDWQVAHN